MPLQAKPYSGSFSGLYYTSADVPLQRSTRVGFRVACAHTDFGVARPSSACVRARGREGYVWNVKTRAWNAI